MEERVSTKDLLVTTYADVRKDITAKTVKVCSHIIKLCISGERKNTQFPSYRHRPFQICTKPLFQSETKCEAIDHYLFFYFHANKTHFLKKGFSLGLVLKVRVLVSRKNGLFFNIPNID